MEKLNGSVGPQTPENPNPNPNHFNTDAEKYRAALKDFQQVINQYGSTNSADMAQYEAGICEFYLGEYPKAENFLKESAKVRETNILYYQSRVALADLYNVWGKPDRAIEVLNEALNAKQNLVPSEYLLMEKGASYEKAGKKKEAIQTYQKILSEYKDSPISYQAQMRLSEVSGK
jgi:tetratricopeptide (TPR) repeat protein